MFWLQVVALVISAIAVGIALDARRRTRKLERREDEAELRQQVHFEVFETTVGVDDVIKVVLINRGTHEARLVSLDGDSVLNVSVSSPIISARVAPGATVQFSYKRPNIGIFNSFAITWEGPGVKRQTITFNPPRPSSDPDRA